MFKTAFTLSTLLTLLLLGCANDSPEKNANGNAGSDQALTLLDQPERPTQLLQTYCYSCHNPTSPSHDGLLAPPMVAVKYRYKQAYPDKAAFVEHMTDFVLYPTRAKALMRNPVRQLGLMPAVMMSKAAMDSIATFIYEAELPAPEWFPEHFKQEHGEEWVQ